MSASSPAETSPFSWTTSVGFFGRGILMGTADVIPGVSGGTVALIVGIYERLVTAISHVDATLLKLLRERRWSDAARHIDLALLVPLLLGIATAILSLGTLMHYLLEHQRQLTNAAFFGLIGASCWLVARLIQEWRAAELILLPAGAISAWWIVSRPALTNPPDGLGYIFLCGLIGICAMILPGISGAFILVILGKYHQLTGIIKQLVHFQVGLEELLVVVVFVAGCACGLIGFSKFLRWLLAHHGSATMALLCGFMAGSLYKIWPFQKDMTPEVVDFKEKVFHPVPLNEVPWDGQFWLTLAVMLAGAGAVLLLDWLALPRAKRVVHDEDQAG